MAFQSSVSFLEIKSYCQEITVLQSDSGTGSAGGLAVEVLWVKLPDPAVVVVVLKPPPTRLLVVVVVVSFLFDHKDDKTLFTLSAPGIEVTPPLLGVTIWLELVD